MNIEQLQRMHADQGFIAALDQSGGSTPKALQNYGVAPNEYENEKQMFDCVHVMRTRVMTSPAFDGRRILAAILFEDTMNRTVKDVPTADYLWNEKRIVPFLKIDKGLAEPSNGVQMMRPIPKLDETLQAAKAKRIFGTKMRSVIHEANPEGIATVVAQQFELARRIVAVDLVPILEPEVDIKSPDREKSEERLLENVRERLDEMSVDSRVMFKFSIPVKTDFYRDLMNDPRVVRVVALSGGYSRDEADRLLKLQHGLIASFSRALLEGLNACQSDGEFNATLDASIREIYDASVT